MVKIGLQLSANLENLEALAPQDENFVWYLKFKCLGCGEVTDKWTSLELNESSEIQGSRGTANLVIKCKLCARVNTVDIIKDSMKHYTTSDKLQTIVAFDCRGIEPVDFQPRDGWKAKAESGKVFEVDLSENEWADYDDKANLTVGVYEIKHAFVKV